MGAALLQADGRTAMAKLLVAVHRVKSPKTLQPAVSLCEWVGACPCLTVQDMHNYTVVIVFSSITTTSSQ
jgi:hypothetical protein